VKGPATLYKALLSLLWSFLTKRVGSLWYEWVDSKTPLTQGDVILNCPLLTWQKGDLIAKKGPPETELLKGLVQAVTADVIVMTQACDLEQRKVSEVILCPHYSLEEYRSVWEQWMKERDQRLTASAWKSHCKDISEGFAWHLSMLNSGEAGGMKTDHRVVDFHHVHSVPRQFLESVIRQRGKGRLRLRAPYREHLSQAFARFFMRVGLPESITKAW
jgi:hypothetical protein